MTDPLRPWRPTPGDPFDLRKAGHLLRRAGFGGSLHERERLVRMGVEAAIASLANVPAGPSAVDALLREAIALGDTERVRSFRVWLALHGEAPLQQRASRFWHDHFATSDRKVMDARAMALQLDTFDRLGLGPFPELLAALVRDPAMLRWLDNDVNVAGRPNENLAREVLELFALGRGNYSERDIREAARAFTGWHVRDERFFLAERLHDRGAKTILGETGAFDGDDVVRLATGRRDSAEFLAAKWLREFVHPEPTPVEIAALADRYEGCGRDVGATLRALLASELFFSSRAFRSKVKSPADWVLGLVKSLGVRAAPRELARAMGRMGELWLEPPSVDGWPSGRAWLDPASWLSRVDFAADLLGGRLGKMRPAAPELLTWARKKPEHLVRAAVLTLLDGELEDGPTERLRALAATPECRGPHGAATILHAITLLPEAQFS